MFKKIAIVVGVVVVCLIGALSVKAEQHFTVGQPMRGYATYDWSFMSAWNLSGGELEVSPNWFNGEYVFWYNIPYYREWIALFIYDDGTKQTRELMWSYLQSHVQ